MDYSLSNALNHNADGIPLVFVLYDVICQYGIHLEKRFRQSPHLSMPQNIVIQKGIGLFHVHGHKKECELRYSPTFIPGMGETDGEILEELWSSLNRSSMTTRTMSTSQRQETLDRHMNDWNWKKMITMGMWMTFVCEHG